MKTFDATSAKNRFGEMLAATSEGPVAIERHGRLVAYVVAPSQFVEQPVGLAERLAARLGALGARYATLFGSIAAGTARSDSDIDVAVSFGNPMSSDLRAAVIGLIADVAGRPVDLVDLENAEGLIFLRALGGTELVCDSPQTRSRMLGRISVAEDEVLSARAASRALRTKLFS
ncbi:MAG: nucleotidyltransferase domain-containing protein [Burkholderiaceae bacterium]|nr:nucleotidyltransferase domain-containing protein [Burkholderiaceae bacterium]